MEGSGLHPSVDGVSITLAHVGLPAGIQGPKCLHATLACRPCVSSCQHICYAHGDQAPQVHPAVLVTCESWQQGC